MRWLVIALFGACGDNLVDEPADSHSGSRLRLYWFEADDGSRSPASQLDLSFDGVWPARFHDAERNEDCELVDWADGATRCTPGVDHRNWELPPFSTTVFVDDACTRPVGRGTAATTYFLHGEWRAKHFVPSVLIRGGGLKATQASYYYERRDGGCTGPLPAAGDLFELGGAVQAGELEVVEQRALASTTRVTELVDETADGLQLGLDLYDRELETRCWPDATRDGSVCAPYPAAQVESRYVDDACTRPALALDDPKIRFAWSYSALDGCSAYFRVGAQATGTSYQRVDGACVPTTAPEGTTVFAIGEPLQLPPIDVGRARSDHRLTDQIVTSAPAAPPFGIYDTELGTGCDYFEDTLFQHPLRCRPTWVTSIEPAFADAACTQPIEVSRQPDGECWSHARFAQDAFSAYRKVGAPVEPFIQTDGGACVPARAPGFRYHALEDTVTDEQLVGAALIHD